MLPRIFHHSDGFLAMGGRNDETILERAQRRQTVDGLGFFRRTVRLAQHMLGGGDINITHSYRAAVPANRFLLSQGISH